MKPLSGRDIMNLMNDDCVIMKYVDLDQYKSLDSLFWKSRFIFLLYPVNSNKDGHWTLVMKRKAKDIDIFDSYGFFPDTQKDNGAMDYHKYLSDLLIRSPKDIKIYYNEIKYQDDMSNACGYYCVLRAWNAHMSNKKFQNILNNEKPDTDQFVYDVVMDNY